MNAVYSLSHDLAATANRAPSTRTAELRLVLDAAAEGVLLHATLDAGAAVHLERRPCVLDAHVENVVMSLPAGMHISVRGAEGQCLALGGRAAPASGETQLTVAGQPLEVQLTAASGEQYVVVCDVAGAVADDGAAALGVALLEAATRLTVARIALPVLPPPGPQRCVSLETAERHIAQVDHLLLAVQRAAAPPADSAALDVFGGGDNFVFPASRLAAAADPAQVTALLTKLDAAVATLADVRVGDDVAALSTVAARHFAGADLALFARNLDSVLAQRAAVAADIVDGRAKQAARCQSSARRRPRGAKTAPRRLAQAQLPQHLRADPGEHSRTRTRLAFHALQTLDACIREHVHTVCGAAGESGASARASAARTFEMRYAPSPAWLLHTTKGAADTETGDKKQSAWRVFYYKRST